MTTKIPLKQYLQTPLWENNQILVSVLGICSALAVSGKLSVALTMGVSVSVVTAFSSLIVSLLRKQTPNSVRMIFQLAVISTFVIIVDQILRAYFFEIAKTLSVFVGLIITNCIVMGRAESMAKNHPPLPAFLDGLGAGMGYTWVLCFIAAIRELLGFGTLFDLRIIPLEWYATADFPQGYQNFSLFTLPVSSFFIVGFFIWWVNSLKKNH